MALPILDGNQTAVTLATTVSGGAHYPNHIIASGTVTVGNSVTVGSCVTHGVTIANSSVTVNGTFWQATQPVSLASVPTHGVTLQSTTVTVSSLPSISGTVTANIGSVLGLNEIYLADWDSDIRFSSSYPFPIYGTVTANSSSQYFNGQSGVTYSYALASWTDGGEIIGSSYSDPVPVQLVQLGNTPSEIFTARIGNSVTVGSLPVQLSTTTIGGTARLNVTLSSATTIGGTTPSYANLYGGSDGTNLRAILVDSSGRTTVTGSVGIIGTPSVTMGSISGTVTATLASTTVTVSSLPSISGTVTANVSSTTVTVSALPSGALTTRFGSCTTANTVQLSSAVTNTARKYLLIQNISTGTVTVGIGHAATTTQGIQLAAGAGLTFDSFCPTGGVWVLSGVTAGPWAIYEG